MLASLMMRYIASLQPATTHLPDPTHRPNAMLKDITNQDEKQERTLAFDGFAFAHDGSFSFVEIVTA